MIPRPRRPLSAAPSLALVARIGSLSDNPSGCRPTSCARCSSSRSSATTNSPGWRNEAGSWSTPPAQTIHAEGAPASCFLVLLAGMLSMSRRVQGGELELGRTEYRGAYTGAFNFYLTNQNVPQVYPATARAVTDCRLFELPAAELGKAVREWYPMAAHLLEGVSTQGMESRDTIERHERLVALGRVTAGLTHQLNNPVAAVSRASPALAGDARGDAGEARPPRPQSTPRRQARGGRRPGGARAGELSRDAPNLSPIEVSDREDEVGDWLGDHGIADAWDIAPILVSAGLGTEWLEELIAVTPPPHLDYGLVLSGPGGRDRQPAQRDHPCGRAHLRSAGTGQAVHPAGPGARSRHRRARGARRHVDDAPVQAHRRLQAGSRVRPLISRTWSRTPVSSTRCGRI